MKEFNSFSEIYKLSTHIIDSQKAKISNYTTQEKIGIVRNKFNKTDLNSYIIVGNIPKYIAKSINSNTTTIKFSVDSLIKNILEHPEISIDEYEKLSKYLHHTEYIFKKNNKHLIYFKINEEIYQFVIKKTQNSDELYLTTFHKASINQLKKDIQRYQNIKRQF